MASENEKTGSVGSVLEQVLEVITFIVPLVKLLFDNGKDPAAEIKRILSADPGIATMRGEWNDRLNQKFGQDG
jgi:hypothetical protein